MKVAETRRMGAGLMALAVLQLLVFLVGAVRRSYLTLAIPVGVGLGMVSGLLFWIGYTMATTDWENPADFGVEEDEPQPSPEPAPAPAHEAH